MIRNPTAVSAPCWTGSGRYALKRTIGRPKAKSDVAWPEAPGEAEPRGGALRPLLAGGDQRRHGGEVVRVGRVAEAEQDATPTTASSVAPSEKCAIQSSRPNTQVDVREGAHGHRQAEAEDDERADRGEEADQTAVEVDAAEDALRADGDEADRRHRAGEAEAEGEDQDEPVADAVERDRREQDDERGRAREDPAGDADPEQPRAR